jgi:molybdenum-dependent DNA-binding transcriptional regulator ModE
MRKILGEPVVVTRRGGFSDRKKKGGGGASLTPVARVLSKEYRSTERKLNEVILGRRTVIAPRQDAFSKRIGTGQLKKENASSAMSHSQRGVEQARKVRCC